MQTFKSILLLTAISVLMQCQEASYSPVDPVDPDPPELGAVHEKLTEADNSFGLKLFGQLSEADPEENIFISPVSIAVALAMAANGADNTTLEQINTVLGFEELDQSAINKAFKDLITYLVNRDPEVATQIANSIWYRQSYSFNQQFLATNHEYFDAEIRGMDFSDNRTVDTINGWVTNKTNGLIDHILDAPISPDLVMFLINAIYFKGTWTYQFEDTATTDSKFYNYDGTQSDIKMMKGNFNIDYYYGEEATLARLPYGNDRYSMLLVLPHYGDDINEFVANLTADKLATWTGSMRRDTNFVALPRFKLEYDKILNKSLQKLGMTDAFIGGLADFSGIREQNDLFIDYVRHKSYVEVNEAGTEAAAVTIVGFATSNGDPHAIFINRPFLFFIQDDETGTILFVGKVNEL